MTSQTHTARYLAAIACLPLVLLLVNDSWAFLTPRTWIDPYIYTGYFLDLRQHLNVFSEAYYGTRLPWILLGASVHAVASAEIASYALRLILFYTGAFSLFAIVRMLFNNDVAATIAAFALGAHSYFLWAIGWDYVDGSGVTLILLMTACLTAAATGKHWRPWLVCAGVTCASMVIGYVVLILLVPFQLGAYLFMNRFHRRHSLAASVIYLGLGAAIAVGVLGTINWTLTGRFLFFLPQLRVAATVSAVRGQWKAPNYNWVGNATWLVFPAIALTVGLVLVASVLVKRLQGGVISDAHRHAVLFALLLVGVESTFLLMELEGFWLLQLSYYASYLIPYVFVCIGGAIALATARVTATRGTLLIGAAAASLIVPFVVASFRPAIACAPVCQLVGQVGSLAIVGALFLAAAAVLSNAWLTVPALVALGMVNISAADRRAFEFPRSTLTHARALMIPDAISAVRPFNLDGNLRFWYDIREPLGGVFRAVASANLWSYRLVSEDFPGRTPPQPGVPLELGLGDTIAVLTSADDAVGVSTRGLSELGMRPELLGHGHIMRGAEGFDLTFIRLMPSSVDGASELDLSAVNIEPKTQAKTGKGDVVVQTSASNWAYAVQFPIPKALRDDFGECSLAVKTRVRVSHTTVGLGILNAAGTDFLARKPLRPTSGVTDVLLGIPRLSDAGNIVVQAWDTATEGEVDVNSITLIRHGCPTRR